MVRVKKPDRVQGFGKVGKILTCFCGNRNGTRLEKSKMMVEHSNSFLIGCSWHDVRLASGVQLSDWIGFYVMLCSPQV